MSGEQGQTANQATPSDYTQASVPARYDNYASVLWPGFVKARNRLGQLK